MPSISALDSHLHRVAHAARQSAMVVATENPASDWGALIVVPAAFFDTEVGKRLEVCCLPVRRKIPNELTRVHLNLDGAEARASVFKAALRKELEPFIIGVGKVTCWEVAEGIVIIGSNDG